MNRTSVRRVARAVVSELNSNAARSTKAVDPAMLSDITRAESAASALRSSMTSLVRELQAALQDLGRLNTLLQGAKRGNTSDLSALEKYNLATIRIATEAAENIGSDMVRQEEKLASAIVDIR